MLRAAPLEDQKPIVPLRTRFEPEIGMNETSCETSSSKPTPAPPKPSGTETAITRPAILRPPRPKR